MEVINNPLPFSEPGICRYCGCDQNHACVSRPIRGYVQTCAWADQQRTVCDNSRCMKKLCVELAIALAASGEPVA